MFTQRIMAESSQSNIKPKQKCELLQLDTVPHMFIPHLHDTITSEQTPPQYLHTKEWRHGNEALS